MTDTRPGREPLTVDRLRTLRELARCDTIAATARALGLTPSAVSQQLSALERETGVALIDRAGRRTALTAAGHALVGHADRVLDALAAAAAELDRVRGTVGGPFRIATVPSAAPALVSPVVAELRARHPDLDLTVIDEEPHRSLDHLDRGTIDLAVVDRYAATPLALGDGLDARPLLVEPLLAVLPAGHPALGRRRAEAPVALADLAGDDWIVAPDEVSCGAAVRSACRAAGFEPRVRWQTDDLLLHLEHVAAGHGVALLPRLGVRAGVAAVEARPTTPAVTRELLAVTRAVAVARPAAAAVLEALEAAARASVVVRSGGQGQG